MQTTTDIRLPLLPRSAFIGGDDTRSWLFTAGEGLTLRASAEAVQQYYANKALAGEGRMRHAAVERACRGKLARLLGADAGDVALLGSASEGLVAAFGLIDWQPGDNIVVPVNDLEFPSVVLPAVRLGARGVELRAIAHDDWQIMPQQIAAAVDARTRIVALSHVSYRTGFRFDLEAVGAAVRAANPDALVVVDATQSLGVVPVPAAACDLLVASTCKWLLGAHGLAVCYWNRARRPDVEPAGIGWYSVVDDLQFPYDLKPDAGRFELGAPNFPALYGLDIALDQLLALGIDRIEQHVLALGDALIAELAERGLPLITPVDRAQRAGIVSWLDADPAGTTEQLERQGILVTGSAGRVRVGLHFYNSLADVERLLAVVG